MSLRLVLALAFSAVLIPAATAVASPPANDNFASAQVVTATSLSGSAFPTQTLNSASFEAGEPSSPFGADQSVWYRWQANYSGTVDLDLCGANVPLNVTVYTGTALNALGLGVSDSFGFECAGTENGATSHFTAVSGTEYRFRVTPTVPAQQSTSFSFRINSPHNDNLFASQTLTGGSSDLFSLFVYLLGATKQLNENNHAGDAGGHSVWFSYTPAVDGPARFSTCSSLTPIDTLLAAYTGSVFPLSQVTATDDDLAACADNIRASTIEFAATAGTTYQIAVDAYHLVPAANVGRVQLYVPMKGDQLAEAQPLAGAQGIAGVAAIDATKEPGEPNHAGDPGGASMWSSWTAPTSGPTTFDTCLFDGVDTLLAVYTGSSYPLTPVASNDDTTSCGSGTDSSVTFDAVAGTTYKVAVDLKGGVRSFSVLNYGVPGNDAFAGATALHSPSDTVAESSQGASSQQGEPKHAGHDPYATLWWTYMPQADGPVTLDACGSDFDTVLAVYTGDALGALTPVAANDDTPGCGPYDASSKVTFDGIAGTTYRIAVGGMIFSQGNVQLVASGPGAPPVVNPAPTPKPSAGTPLVYSKLAHTRVRDLRRGRTTLTLACSRACTAIGTLALARALAHRLHLAATPKLVTVASGKANGAAGKKVTLRFRPTKRVKGGLAHARSLRATLALTVTDSATGQLFPAQRSIKLKR